MSNVNPWVDPELPEPTKRQSLVDQIADVFKKLWTLDIENARNLASSTDKSDAVQGSVTIDKILLAALVKQEAPAGTSLANAKVGEIARVMHHATKRFGKDRISIAKQKALYLLAAQEDEAEAEDEGTAATS